MTRAGYDTPNELIDDITDKVYRMFKTGDFGKFGKLDKYDPASYEMPIGNIISRYYAIHKKLVAVMA